MTARPAATRVGRAAEAFCALLLRLKGYRVLARNFRVPQGEIDIIARRGRVVSSSRSSGGTRWIGP